MMDAPTKEIAIGMKIKDLAIASRRMRSKSRASVNPSAVAAIGVMTNGNYGTQIVANEMYAQAFVQFDIGRGSALAVVLFVAVIPLIIFNVVQLRKDRATR